VRVRVLRETGALSNRYLNFVEIYYTNVDKQEEARMSNKSKY
jgi:hypothetical protein